MRSFKEFINGYDQLDETISNEFKDVAGPLILKEFGDYMNRKGLSVQNANFIRLSDSEKTALKRKLSEKKLDDLPFGQRFIAFVSPFDKEFYKDFMNARKNPDPEHGFSRDWSKHISGNLGNITILDRSDGTFHHIWINIDNDYDFKNGKLVYKAPEALSRTENIYQGVTTEFKSLINNRYNVAFTFDTKENDTWKLRNDRRENRATNDLLKPMDGYLSRNALSAARTAKFNQIKNNKTNILYTDKIKSIGDNLINDIKNDIDQFFKDLKSNPKDARSNLYSISRKIERYGNLLDNLRGSYTSSSDYSKDIENAIRNFK